MAELDQESKETSVQTNWKKVGFVALLLLVIVVLASSIGPGAWRQLTREYRLHRTPEFTFTFSGLPDPNDPTYEVTFDMFYARAPLGKFGVSISADYRGSGYEGPVDVTIRPATGEPRSVGRWDNFKNDHATSQVFTLTERSLFEYSAVPLVTSVVGLADGVVDTPSEGTFDIEVTAADGTRLARKTAKVVNTPWSHAAQLSDSLIGATQSITAYVTVRNIGAPAEFYVVGNLYDATSVSPDTIEQGEDGWSPAKSWGEPQVSFGELSPGVVQTGAKFTIALPIDSGQFEARHTYILETFALKHLPGLEFSPGDWRTSPESWRVRDNPTYMMIVVPAGME
jgi:hypothetical protein